MITPNTVFTDNLNGTLITYNGNEFSLQNDMGNINVGEISEGFYPIGMTEHGGILYIVSVKDSNDFRRYTLFLPSDYNTDETIEHIISEMKEVYPYFGQKEAKDLIKWFGDDDSSDSGLEEDFKGWLYFFPEHRNQVIEKLVDLVSEYDYSTFYESDSQHENLFEVGSYPSLPREYQGQPVELEKEYPFEYVYKPLYNLVTSEETKEIITKEVNVIEYVIDCDTSGLQDFHDEVIAQRIADDFYDNYVTIYGFTREDSWNLINGNIGHWASENENDITVISSELENCFNNWEFEDYTISSHSQQKMEEKITVESSQVYSISLHVDWSSLDDEPDLFLQEIATQVGVSVEDVSDWIDNYVYDRASDLELPTEVWSTEYYDDADNITQTLGGYDHITDCSVIGPMEQDKIVTELVPVTKIVTETVYNSDEIRNFTTNMLSYNKQHPVTIETQSSYDGSVNLILNDNYNPPRLINTAFATIGNGQGKFIERHQGARTNYYAESKLDTITKLIQNSSKFTYIDLGDGYSGDINGVQTGGQLKGGNYTFYLRYGDEDKNQTDIVCESGIISVFHGTPGDPFSVTGAYMDEITDKLIYLTVREIDINFSKIFISYTREYCDQNGYRLVEAKAITDPYVIDGDTKTILINGLETTEEISIEDLNIKYHTVSQAKAIAQQQDMLFLGNIKNISPNNDTLQQLSYKVKVTLKQESSIGYIDPETYSAKEIAYPRVKCFVSFRQDGDINLYSNIQENLPEIYRDLFGPHEMGAMIGYPDGYHDDNVEYMTALYNAVLASPQEQGNPNERGYYKIRETKFIDERDNKYSNEYYNPKNIYYKLGYWPEEYYRLGIVYIKADGTRTDAFDLLGCNFADINTNNNPEGFDISELTGDSICLYNWNIKGVFKIPKINVIGDTNVKPIYFSINLDSIKEQLAAENIIGYFIVRQKRIPITIAQGLSVGISENAFIPMICTDNDDSDELEFYTESFITNNLDDDSSDEGEITDFNRLLLYNKDATAIGPYICNLQLPVGSLSRSPFNTGGRKIWCMGVFTDYTDCPMYIDEDNNLTTLNDVTSESGATDICMYLVTYWGTTDDRKKHPDAYLDRVKKRAFATCLEWAENNGISIIDKSLHESIHDFNVFPNKFHVGDGELYTYTATQWKKKWTERNAGIDIAGIFEAKTSIKDIEEASSDPALWFDTITVQTGYHTFYTPIIRANQFQFTKTCRYDVPTDSSDIRPKIDVNSCYLSNVNYIKQNIKESQLTKDRYTGNYQRGTIGLLSKEITITPEQQSIVNGNEFNLQKYSDLILDKNGHIYYQARSSFEYDFEDIPVKAMYIPDNTSLKYINTGENSFGFSTKVGTAEDNKKIGFLDERPTITIDDAREENVIRGAYTDFVGIYGSDLSFNSIYSLKLKDDKDAEQNIIVRGNNNDAFYAITKLTPISDEINVYGGDCYSNTVTIRMIRNFIDPVNPVADEIVDIRAWRENYKGMYDKQTKWEDINLTDLNTVDLGHWITFKCLSSINLALRSEDRFNTTEYALIGNPRSFYPHYPASSTTSLKVPDTTLFNHGYDATVGRIRYSIKEKTPYDKNEFSTRVMFSNVAITDSFQNGYRTFQGTSYKDYQTTYGDITKLLPWGQNLFCVFEHGIAIIPVNQKALMNTTTEDTIHIYGYGVLPEDLSVISQDFGSIWADSIIRTPLGIYGVDTSTKKIWQYTDSKGLITISDMKIQRFLNDEINIGLKSQEDLGVTNVKTHYNIYKGDVMFTFYNTNDNGIKKEWNICYNERQGLWITRYSWIPLLSANADNTFYSIELHKWSDSNKNIEEDRPFGIWKHGRTGIDRLILPTHWYDIQEPFEFEFVAGEPMGIDKIFENLKITSNNVQPESFDFQIIGDDYLFNRARIYHELEEQGKLDVYGESAEDIAYAPQLGYPTEQFTKQEYQGSPKNESWSPLFYNARLTYDRVLDEYELVVSQPCRNKEVYGIRRGNIQYRDNAWHTDIEPLRYNPKLKNPNTIIADLNNEDPNKFVSAKLRDKWMKVKIKYKGDRLAIIGAVTTTENISYV